MIVNNKLTMTVARENNLGCVIKWCETEAHFHLHAEANGDADFSGDFCCLHALSMLQNIVDHTERGWATGKYPEKVAA